MLGLAGLTGAALTFAVVAAFSSTRVAATTPPLEPRPAAPPRLIEVSGSARLDVPPDRVDLTLMFEEKLPSPRAAVKQLSTQRALVVRGLFDSGIRGKDLVISQLSLHPSYVRLAGGREKIDGYVASASLVATLRDPTRIGDVMEIAAGLGVTRIYSIARTSKGPEMKKRVREMALRAAREKAEQIARELGVEVGLVQSVRELQQGFAGRGWYGGLVNAENRVAAAPGSSDQPEKAVAPDAIQLHLDVGVTFAIR
jgi:uncharacterized protein YggE